MKSNEFKKKLLDQVSESKPTIRLLTKENLESLQNEEWERVEVGNEMSFNVEFEEDGETIKKVNYPAPKGARLAPPHRPTGGRL